MNRIPCTVGILTRNSGHTLQAALESVRDFAECIVCDGSSTDQTLSIARSLGAHILEQDKQFLDAEGRIINYAGVRNQTLHAASQEWFFFLDSDEYITSELAEEIRRVVSGSPKVFWVKRYYTWGGERVTCATTYPNKQMRLFHRSMVKEFIKTVHERIELRPHVVVDVLKHYMVVPLDTTPDALWRKWDRYIELGGSGSSLDFFAFLQIAMWHIRPSLLYAARLLRIFLFCRGARLPLWRELAEHRYNLKVIRSLWRRMYVRQNIHD